MALRLVIAVVQQRDMTALDRALATAGFGYTHVSSSGGFLLEGNATLFLVVDEGDVEALLDVLAEHSHTRTRYLSPISPLLESGGVFPPSPVKVRVGGAHIFVLPVEALHQLGPAVEQDG